MKKNSWKVNNVTRTRRPFFIVRKFSSNATGIKQWVIYKLCSTFRIFHLEVTGCCDNVICHSDIKRNNTNTVPD